MPNPWLEHVKKVRSQRKMNGKSYKEVLKHAATTYKRKGPKKGGPPAKKAKKCPEEKSV